MLSIAQGTHHKYSQKDLDLDFRIVYCVRLPHVWVIPGRLCLDAMPIRAPCELDGTERTPAGVPILLPVSITLDVAGFCPREKPLRRAGLAWLMIGSSPTFVFPIFAVVSKLFPLPFCFCLLACPGVLASLFATPPMRRRHCTLSCTSRSFSRISAPHPRLQLTKRMTQRFFSWPAVLPRMTTSPQPKRQNIRPFLQTCRT